QVGELQSRHQQFDGAGAILLFAHDLLDFLQHAETEWQPCIDAGCLLPHHPSAQHKPMRGYFRLFWGLAQDGQKIAGKAHRSLGIMAATTASETALRGEKQGLSMISGRICSRNGYGFGLSRSSTEPHGAHTLPPVYHGW